MAMENLQNTTNEVVEVQKVAPNNRTTVAIVVACVLLGLVIAAGVAYVFLVQQDAPQDTELIRNEVERENVTPQPQDSVSQGSAPATALGKAIASLQKAISDDTSKTVHEQNYSDSYSYHYFGSFEGRALVTAMFDDPSGYRNERWDLLLIEKDGTQTTLYSGLLQDCCGGGMPEIKVGTLPFLVEIVSSTGDVCFSIQETIYVNVRDNPKSYTRVTNTHACESFATLSVDVNNETTYLIRPLPTLICTAQNVGAATSVVGLMAVSNEHTYTKYFDTPIDMRCSTDPNFDNVLYSRSVGYKHIKLINDAFLDFDVSVFDVEKQETLYVPVRFSLREGFEE